MSFATAREKNKTKLIGLRPVQCEMKTSEIQLRLFILELQVSFTSDRFFIIFLGSKKEIQRAVRMKRQNRKRSGRKLYAASQP